MAQSAKHPTLDFGRDLRVLGPSHVFSAEWAHDSFTPLLLPSSRATLSLSQINEVYMNSGNL